MDTVETREQTPPPAGTVYDGFISYSHAADDLLAPRLQAGLQRFAKPWWKRRALRIFRDESSLSANPHLWSSITDALDTSDWFVLLLSPDAADSEWVNQEVEYWLEHKDADRIIPVVTDGEFTWSETDIDLESTAAPPALYGAFSDEPRWVDLRFARSEEQLDLNNPRFSAAVADIASAIRGVPKDELESEEVRQHRRTVRTAWGAGMVVLLLALLAGAAALFALDQRNEARHQAEVAHARELTLAAEKVVEFDPELSAHLSLSALGRLRAAGENLAQAEAALRAAISDDRVTFRVPGGGFVAVHPGGSLLAAADVVDDAIVGVAVWDIATHEVVERYSRDAGIPIVADFSPDGNLLAVGFEDAVPAITIWNRTTGGSVDLGPDRVGEYILEFSPDGKLLALEAEVETEVYETEVWSVDDGQVVHRADSWGPDFSRDGRLSYIEETADGGATTIVVVDPVTFETVRAIPSDLYLGFATWSPDANRIVGTDGATAMVIDVSQGTVQVRTELDRAWTTAWLNNDEYVVGGESVPKVIDATTGEVRMELPGQAGSTFDFEVVPGTTNVASAGIATSGAGTVIFDTPVIGGSEVGAWSSPVATNLTARFVGDGSRVFVEDGLSYVIAGALDGGSPQVVEGVSDLGWSPGMDASGNFVFHPKPDGAWVLRSLETNAVTYEAPMGWWISGASRDGTQAVIKEGAGFCGTVRLVSTRDGTGIDLDTPCVTASVFSPDGELVVTGRGNANDITTAFFDTSSGDLLAHLGGTPYGGVFGAFTPDARKFLVGSFDGLLAVLDVETVLSGVPIEDSVDLKIAAHDTLVFRVMVSPDGTKVATSAVGEPLKLWDFESGQSLGEFGSGGFGGPHVGDFHPTLPQLLVTTPPNQVRIHTLDIDELIAIAKAGLSREMTNEECLQYFREPCPAS